jgi:hypothetical protein
VCVGAAKTLIDWRIAMGTTPRNEGEGNKSADRNYREATQKFVESDRGRRAARDAGNVSSEEEQDIRRAEEIAKDRAKEHDPDEVRKPSRPA